MTPDHTYYFRIPKEPKLDTRAILTNSGPGFAAKPKAPGQHKKAKARRRLTKASKRANR